MGQTNTSLSKTEALIGEYNAEYERVWGAEKARQREKEHMYVYHEGSLFYMNQYHVNRTSYTGLAEEISKLKGMVSFADRRLRQLITVYNSIVRDLKWRRDNLARTEATAQAAQAMLEKYNIPVPAIKVDDWYYQQANVNLRNLGLLPEQGEPTSSPS